MKIVYRVGSLMLVLAFLLLLLPLSQQVNADGGAPNLAYVAGAAHGISVIDISQQKVTSNITVDGDPQMILLSLDGRYLYVTQPTLGRVAILSAATGKIICTASLPGQPSLLALGPETGALYAAGNGASIVSVLDPTTCAVQHTFQTPKSSLWDWGGSCRRRQQPARSTLGFGYHFTHLLQSRWTTSWEYHCSRWTTVS